MAFMEWEESYAVRVAQIDEQHKRLIALINDLDAAVARDGVRSTIDSAVDEFEAVTSVVDALVSYTLNHFAMEEEYMVRWLYPGYDEHKRAHQAAISRVNTFETDIEHGKAVSARNVARFLKDWLQSHILDVDKRLGVFLNERGVR